MTARLASVFNPGPVDDICQDNAHRVGAPNHHHSSGSEISMVGNDPTPGVATTFWRFLRHQVRHVGTRQRFYTASRASADAAATVATSTDAYNRMLALYEWADSERAMAETVHGFWGAESRDVDGFTLAASCDLAVRLLAMVADSEAALCISGALSGALYEPDTIGLPVGPEADAVLTALRTETRPAPRAALVMALHAAVVGMVGKQAAHTVASVAACYYELSGMSDTDIMRRVWGER